MTRKTVEKIFWVKIRQNVVVLHFLAIDNFNFPRKIVEKYRGKNNS